MDFHVCYSTSYDTIFGKAVQTFDCDDNIDIITRNFGTVVETCVVLKAKAMPIILEMNVTKTKYMT